MQAGSSGLQYSPFLLDTLLLFGFSDFKLYTFFLFSSFACRSCRRQTAKSSPGIPASRFSPQSSARDMLQAAFFCQRSSDRSPVLSIFWHIEFEIREQCFDHAADCFAFREVCQRSDQDEILHIRPL